MLYYNSNVKTKNIVQAIPQQHLTAVFHLAISNIAQRHVDFYERHVALYERHVALHVCHVALYVRHVALLICRQYVPL